MKKIPKKAYTAEFKELAVKRVSDGQTITEAAKELGLSSQSLRNWIKAAVAGKLTGAGSKVVTPEAMELSRRRAEVARLTRENEIKKKQRRTLREMFCEVRLDWHAYQAVCADRNVRCARRERERLSSVEARRQA